MDFSTLNKREDVDSAFMNIYFLRLVRIIQLLNTLLNAKNFFDEMKERIVKFRDSVYEHRIEEIAIFAFNRWVELSEEAINNAKTIADMEMVRESAPDNGSFFYTKKNRHMWSCNDDTFSLNEKEIFNLSGLRMKISDMQNRVLLSCLQRVSSFEEACELAMYCKKYSVSDENLRQDIYRKLYEFAKDIYTTSKNKKVMKGLFLKLKITFQGYYDEMGKESSVEAFMTFLDLCSNKDEVAEFYQAHVRNAGNVDWNHILDRCTTSRRCEVMYHVCSFPKPQYVRTTVFTRLLKMSETWLDMEELYFIAKSDQDRKRALKKWYSLCVSQTEKEDVDRIVSSA